MTTQGHRYLTLPVDMEWADAGLPAGVVALLERGGRAGTGTGTGTGTGERESLPGVVGVVCARADAGDLVAAVVEVAAGEHVLVTGRGSHLARVANATHESMGATSEGIAAMATGRPPALHLVRAHDGGASRVTVALPNLGDSRVHALFFHDGHAWVLIGRTLVAVDLAMLPSHVGNASIAAEYRPFGSEGPGPLEAPAIEIVTLL